MYNLYIKPGHTHFIHRVCINTYILVPHNGNTKMTLWPLLAAFSYVYSTNTHKSIPFNLHETQNFSMSVLDSLKRQVNQIATLYHTTKLLYVYSSTSILNLQYHYTLCITVHQCITISSHLCVSFNKMFSLMDKSFKMTYL